MKKIKRISALLLLLVVFVSTFAICASAVNTTDYRFYHITINSTTDFVKLVPRAKEDSSAVYLYTTNSSEDLHRTRVYGYDPDTNTYTNRTWVNRTLVNYVNSRVGVKYSIHNNIYESGYTMASIGFQGYYPFNYMIEGWWSADSANHYTDAT